MQNDQIIVCYKCHQFRDISDFYSSLTDPLAQICKICKEDKNADN